MEKTLKEIQISLKNLGVYQELFDLMHEELQFS